MPENTLSSVYWVGSGITFCCVGWWHFQLVLDISFQYCQSVLDITGELTCNTVHSQFDPMEWDDTGTPWISHIRINISLMSGRLVEPFFFVVTGWFHSEDCHLSSISRLAEFHFMTSCPCFHRLQLCDLTCAVCSKSFQMHLFKPGWNTQSSGERAGIRLNNCSSNLSNSHMYGLWVIKWLCSKAVVNLVIHGRMCVTVTIWKIYSPWQAMWQAWQLWTKLEQNKKITHRHWSKMQALI